LVIAVNAGPIIVLVVPPDDNAWDPQDGLISAAHATASWARARRATWTRLPPTAGAAVPVESESQFEFLPAPVRAPRKVAARAPAEVPATAPLPPPDSGIAAADAPAPEPSALAIPKRARNAIVSAALTGGRFVRNVLPTRPAKTPAVEPDPASDTPAAPAPGSLRVSSTPPGAVVLVDGTMHGVTPLTIDDLIPGRHDLVLKANGGTVQRTVNIASNQTATIDQATFSGFVAVHAPFDVTISEGGRALRADDRHQIVLPAGPHELRLTNTAVGYDTVRQVNIKPGRSIRLELALEPTLTVTATAPAEVWLDGTRLGETPLTGAPVPLGLHQIVVKRTGGGERRFTVTIGAKPLMLHVEF
jgi:PEGA domain-containing protein